MSIVDDLEATTQFLGQYRTQAGGAAADAAATRQAEALRGRIAATSLTAGEGMRALQVLSRDAAWSPTNASMLAEAVETAIANRNVQSASMHNRTQKMARPLSYITRGFYRFLDNEPKGFSDLKVATFAEYVVRLGLRNPGERTAQALTGTMIIIVGDGDLSREDKHNQLLC